MKPIKTLREQGGFTLIEILIVVILLGILATIIVPQITVSSDDAKLSSLKTNLSAMRSSIELYYYQHDNTYPGQKKQTDGLAVGTDGEAAAAFVPQLTRYTDLNGISAVSGTSVYPYGPYLREGIPTNPYNNLNTVVCDYDETDITQRDSTGANSGWKFYPVTGVLIAADGSHDSL